MAEQPTNTISPLGESFGNLEDIQKTIAFGEWIIDTLDSIFLGNNIFLENEEFMELYTSSKIVFNETLDFYEKLTKEYENPIHAKQLIDLLYALYQSGLTGTSGTLKRSIITIFLKPFKYVGKIPLKKLLELLNLINIYLGSLSKALQSADALDEAKKYGEHILTTIDLDLEEEFEIKRGGHFKL
tara:strand:+ start:8828 stop:9382 length:555 start_codon:yes stop_codon:yes gene_type:complete